MHLNDPSSEVTDPVCSVWLAEAVQAAALRLNAARQSIFSGPQSHLESTTCLDWAAGKESSRRGCACFSIFLIERILFPLYLPIYMMNFSGQRIILFEWYLTSTHLIFAGQRRKTDWGKTWGWMLFRWRVSFVPCPAFLMIGNNEEVTLKKNNGFSFFWDCLKYQSQHP